jgi:hypothetical protein
MKLKKLIFVAIILFSLGCNNTDTNKQVSIDTNQNDQIKSETKEVATNLPLSNERFKNVTVTKITQDSIFITGKAIVFEAVLNWTLKDGDKEIKSGYQTTSAGAPEWGKFEFGLKIPEKESNSALRLVLFEVSAKDGSRNYELTIPID